MLGLQPGGDVTRHGHAKNRESEKTSTDSPLIYQRQFQSAERILADTHACGISHDFSRSAWSLQDRNVPSFQVRIPVSCILFIVCSRQNLSAWSDRVEVLSAVLAHLEDSQRHRVAEMLRSDSTEGRGDLGKRSSAALFGRRRFQLRHVNPVTICHNRRKPLEPTCSFSRHGLSYWRHRDMR